MRLLKGIDCTVRGLLRAIDVTIAVARAVVVLSATLAGLSVVAAVVAYVKRELMRTLDASVEIAAPPERVWELISDLPAYARWNPFIVRAGGELAVGGRLHITIAAPGHRPVTFRPTVLELEPGQSVTWLGRTLLPGLFDGHHTLSVTATEGGARFRTSEEVSGILVPLLGGIMRDSQRGFELMAAAVKARAEGRGGGT
jgi:hypothetical protein